MNKEPKYTDLNIVVVGCGNWGKNHIRVLHQLGALYGLVDTQADTLAPLCEQYHVPAFSLAEALQDERVTGIVIASPATSHFLIAQQALQAQKHVLVEKPLTMTAEESRTLSTLASAQGLTLMVGHILQYHPAFKALKAMQSAGTLGQLQYVYSNRLNLGKFASENDIWWSYAPHDVSILLSLMNEMPETVTATSTRALKHTTTDMMHAHFTFPGNKQAHIYVSWLHPYKEQKLVVIGDKAMAIFDDTQPWDKKLQQYPYPDTWQDGLPSPALSQGQPIALEAQEPLLLEDEHFLQSIQSGQPPLTDGHEGTRVVEVLSAAIASAQHKVTRTLSTQAADDTFIHPTAHIAARSHIGVGTKIWRYSQVHDDAWVGDHCRIGQNVSIGPNVSIGHQCKIQNNVSLFDGVTLAAQVFVGPSVTFTNVMTPRAFIERKDSFKKTKVCQGATIGANATIVCGITIHPYAFIAAGSVVTRDVPAYSLVAGNPAKPIGWVNKQGERVTECPRTEQIETEDA